MGVWGYGGIYNNQKNVQFVNFVGDGAGEEGSDTLSFADMMTALMILCACNRTREAGDMVECAKLMVAKGARVNTQDRHCMCALMYACQRGREKLAAMLVSAGAEVNKQDSRGWTASEGGREGGRDRMGRREGGIGWGGGRGWGGEGWDGVEREGMGRDRLGVGLGRDRLGEG